MINLIMTFNTLGRCLRRHLRRLALWGLGEDGIGTEALPTLTVARVTRVTVRQEKIRAGIPRTGAQLSVYVGTLSVVLGLWGPPAGAVGKSRPVVGLVLSGEQMETLVRLALPAAMTTIGRRPLPTPRSLPGDIVGTLLACQENHVAIGRIA